MGSTTQRSDAMRREGVYRWQVVAMLWLVCFFIYADRQAIYAVFPLLEEEFGFDKFQLGLIGSAFMWVYAAGAPFAGFIADRVKRVHLILGGCIFWSLVTVATAWCSRLWQFVAVRALEGFGETFYFPASMSLTADYHGPRTRGRAFSLHQSSVYAGTILGSWLGAVLAERYGWRVGFFAFGLAGIIVAAVLYAFLREPDRGAADREEEIAIGGHHAPALSTTAALGIADTAAVVFRRPAVLLLMLGFLGANIVAGRSSAIHSGPPGSTARYLSIWRAPVQHRWQASRPTGSPAGSPGEGCSCRLSGSSPVRCSWPWSGSARPHRC